MSRISYLNRLFATLFLASPFALHAQPRACLVVGISDGDTLTARCGTPGNFEQVKVRLAAVDAPEKGQPFGQRSKEALSDLCYMQVAQIEPRTLDRYGRTVADVACRGRDAGTALVAGGWAWVYVKYVTADDAPLFRVEAAARARHLGLWRDAGAEAPWEWRKAHR